MLCIYQLINNETLFLYSSSFGLLYNFTSKFDYIKLSCNELCFANCSANDKLILLIIQKCTSMKVVIVLMHGKKLMEVGINHLNHLMIKA